MCRALTGARIESQKKHLQNAQCCVAPSRARELKESNFIIYLRGGDVAPSRARELKDFDHAFDYADHLSRPHGRAN